MSYDNFKEWSFYIVGNPTRMDIRPYSLLIEHSPQEVSSILDELEEALCEASGKMKQYWKKLDEFESICGEIVGEDGGCLTNP